MRFPSLDLLAARAATVARRFPWTIAAGVITAVAAIAVAEVHDDDLWVRAAFVSALGLPLTVALTLLTEARRWGAALRSGVLLVGAGALVLFFLTWPGLDQPQHAIRYFQLSAVLHLSVAFLPFFGNRSTLGFWQFNRRLFLGILRSAIFSAVIFVGLAIALGALDKLFGVHVASERYIEIWFVAAFVINTWIFLAAVPEDLEALSRDDEYPKALKVFAQYILTPLAFGYLLILLAYLVKIVAGGEWPNGWIGWLVASVAVTGLLGFLLVEPLRADPDEGWIRIYARTLFLGLIPAALMLLAAFWKRIEPYGLTEPRTLGLLLGFWLLGIAVLFAARPATNIRIIPIALAAVLALTVYGPFSVTNLSIGSQGRRLAAMLALGPRGEGPKESSAALRFLIDHRAGAEIAARLGQPLPPIAWDSVSRRGPDRDSLATHLLALAGGAYVREGTPQNRGNDFSIGKLSNAPIAVSGFDWLAEVFSGDSSWHPVGADSVQVLPLTGNGLDIRIRAGQDTLHFDVATIVQQYRDSAFVGENERMLIAADGAHRASLLLTQLNGTGRADSLRVRFWSGKLLLHKAP